MKTTIKKYRILWLLSALLLTVVGCSTEKNTSQSRWWHSFNARYNTYYNGTLAYIDASLEKEKGNQDNFTEMIPMYSVGNKKSRELGKGNYDKAIEKCEKAIKLHSITRRPEWNKSRRKTEKDIEWLSRKEYNPFLWKAWMLMGRSQFYKGAFDEAASTFAYMSRIYATQPAIYGRARAWLAKCYVEQEWLYDAEDVIRNMNRDSIHWRAQKEWDFTMADYYIHTAEYDKAVPYLKKSIKHEMRKVQRARLCFLLGQVYAALGDNAAAYKAFRSVVAKNPPYQMEFNARIAMTEVMGATQAKKMVGSLKRMAASDKNKDYLDQVYYAIGNIYMAQRDTANAIANYEKGAMKATRAGIEKGVLLLKLGDIYWQKEKFADARRCYGEAIGLLDKERDDYEQLSTRSKVLDELVPFTDAVYLQDSLQALAKMDEKQRNEAIDRVITALKKKEKEERDRQAEANAQQTLQRNGGNSNSNTATRPNTTTPQGGRQDATWYFYSAMAVQQGKQTFERQWGKRENVDNWQRINKTVVAGLGGTDEAELTEEQKDSIEQAEAVQDSLEQVNDSAQNDPHKREYYLAQIPFTEEQVAASNVIIMDGLYNSGVIFKDKLDNLDLSEKALRRLEDKFPDFEHNDDLYYHMFLLYSRMGQHDMAASYVEKLRTTFPESQWTTLLTDPYFEENAVFGTHLEDSLYAATYEAFKHDRLQEIAANAYISETRFPIGANRDKFLFIGGLAKLNGGDATGCLADMRILVEKFPQSKLAEMAGMIVNGVKEGRPLHGGKFDLGDVWSRRTAVLADSDSINARQLDPERNTKFVYVLAYLPDSVDENKLLYQMAKFNFANYIVRNFEISFDDDNMLRRLVVSGFRNYDEAWQYARHLHTQTALRQLAEKARSLVISEENLALIGTNFSYADYQAFYDEHFAPLETIKQPLLNEPVWNLRDSEDEPSAKPAEEKTPADTPADGLFNIDENEGAENTDTEIIPLDDGGGNIPAKSDKQEDEGTLTLPADSNDTSVDTPADSNTMEIDDPDTPEPQVNQDNPNDQKTTVTPVDIQEVIQDDIQEDTQTSDDTIYFDDTPQPTQGTTKQKTTENTYDLEDEYYELDGF
ncbi:MAG: hypothetical protein SPJ82_01115 [Prevotella sp.]|nr:hypothetical protein [Prevotella sp.]